ncbi:SAM-dependent methyltransferase [Mycobacterium sp. CBMA 234]|uniref:SAM-dependent methyltransferase n=1 Tax=Mycolicibacterium sp. CBMA 234 TaxID=1918495 RepID=UPI0012DBEB57|nr:SAM-dependent methyltransferase [Mycolicibacterium sp. CBMA 234]MUL65219.1 SAM-dependent methyltransferase [Mycolicibacterium sp. CBMA 234]
MPESSVVVQPDPLGSSRLQTVGLRTATKLFELAAAEVPIPPAPQPVVIAEYGCGNAHNGLLPIGAGIVGLRKRTRPEQPIAVTHTDIPDNDFSAMFRTLRDDPFSYLRTDRATFASAVGRSYLSQVLPSESVHLGWSAWAIHWLSRMPTDVTDHIQASYSADARVRAACARQAAHDWHEFIAFRGRELSPGGRLVLMTLGQHDDGRPGLEPLFDGIMQALSDLRTQRLITDDELRRMHLPIVGRSEADFRSPFAPSGRFERLEITHLMVTDEPDRFWQRYQIDGDAIAFAKSWVGFTRAAVFDTLLSALGPADPNRAHQLADALEAALIELIVAAPEPMPVPVAHIIVQKQRR